LFSSLDLFERCSDGVCEDFAEDDVVVIEFLGRFRNRRS